MAEIIVEPTALSKVIPLKFKINDVDVPKTTQLSTNKQFNTTDTDAWFSFELDGLASTNGTYDLTLINLDDKSIFHHANVLFQALPFHYKLNSSEDVTLNEIRHAGRWLGQLVVTLSNGDTTARQFGFNIAGHILDGQDAQVILLSDYQALINTINLAKDDLAQYNVDYAALIADVDAKEALREQAEIDRAATFAALVDSEMIAQNVETKLTEKEATYAPRLLSVESELAEMKPAFASSVNKFGAKQKPFLKFRQALLKKQVNVTYWTDSIGTGGSKLGINSATPSGTEQAPNGIVNSEGMSHFITKELAKANPDVVFNFYNRGIGGTRITEWNALKTFDAVEKTWVEHIKDTSPDLLFVSFGMNHSLYSTTKTFASSLKALCGYINLNFSKVPDIVLVTSPTPVVVEGNTTWSDDINQESRRNTGKSARYFGLPYVDYVLDVSRFSDIARFGKDLENCYFEQKTDFTTVGSTSLMTNSRSLKINGKYRDFTLKFLFTTANVTNREYLLIRFNRDVGDVDISNQLCIFPNYDGITKIESLGRFADATNLAYKTAIYNHPSMTTAQYIRVEKKGNILKVFIGDDPETLVIYDDKLDVNNVLGEIEFIKKGGSVSTINLLKLAFYEPKYVEYKKTISEAEMWGAFVNLDYNTKPITGGNGVNHPSSRGVAQVYGTPINEMISDIDKLSSNLSEVNLEIYKDYINFVANAGALVGYCYVNFGVSDLILLEGFVYSADLGIKLKRNKKVTKQDDRALLLDDEYGIYITGGVPQIIFKNTMGATGFSTPFKFYTYKFM